MPMYPETDQVTPFSIVLTNFIARQRPLWNTTKLRRVLGHPRQTIGNWLYHGVTPDINTMFKVMVTLGISLSELVDAYHELDLPVPELLPQGAVGGERPATTARAEQAETAAAVAERERQASEERAQEWQRMIDNTRAIMQEAGMPAPALDALLAHVEEKRSGQGQLARNIAAEHRQPETERTSERPQRTSHGSSAPDISDTRARQEQPR